MLRERSRRSDNISIQLDLATELPHYRERPRARSAEALAIFGLKCGLCRICQFDRDKQ